MTPIRKILVPVDFSAGSADAFAYALALATRFDAKLEVLHVWEPSPNIPNSRLAWIDSEPAAFWEQVHNELTARLDDFVRQHAGTDVAAITQRVEAGYVAHSILAAIDHEHYDMVVMGTHGRTGLSHFLLGSIAERVVRLAPCPVLTVRSSEKKPKLREKPESKPAQA